EDVSRLVLGTVQLGMPYGIANMQGQPSAIEAARIVEAAWACGIRHFDTAQAYGTSESVLGQALRDLGVQSEAQIESKFAATLDPKDTKGLSESIERSVERLGIDRLWCMMLHRAPWLDHWDEGLGAAIQQARAAGLIRHFGASITMVDEAPLCLAHKDVEVIQLACNAWDRRPVTAGTLAKARSNGQLCCIRSVYLKGLLTLPVEAVAERLAIARDAAERWHALCRRYGISPVEMAMRFALTLDAPLVVGAETAEQVRDTARLASLEPLAEDVLADLAATMDPALDDTILTPNLWEKLDGAVVTPSESHKR
ncbi:MAG TPA: aldo/keto reductase, partial [Candidatus Hydrogenedentes bacterium]|nr:aldo/keto reductase [Candidatus Hydrogenedentota bacterium]